MIPSITLNPVLIRGTYAVEFSASINPNNLVTSFYFEYSTDGSFGSSNVTPTETIMGDTGENLIKRFVYGLLANTTYFFKLIASNSSGVAVSDLLTFKTLKLELLTPVLQQENTRGLATTQEGGIYRDWNQFTPYDNPYIYGVPVVAQGFNNVIRTPKKTRFFDNAFGSDYESLPFELLDFMTEDLARTYIFNCTEFEPRAVIDNTLTSFTSSPDDSLLSANIVFGVGEQSEQLYQLDIDSFK